MSFKIKGLAAAAIAVSACIAPVSAADLGGRGGSIKDGYIAQPPVYAQPSGPAGPCYFRSDVGYSWSRNPHAEYVGNAVDQRVYHSKLEDGSLVEAGFGCAMGSRGFRAEMMLGSRQEKRFNGDVNIVINQAPVDPPIETHVKSYTMMFNAYHDLGKFGGFVPYVGAGLGWAYHKMGDVMIHDPNSPNPQMGEDKLSFAWSLMAGVGYQLTDRAILDVGYRYIDMGLARSSHIDSAFERNPRLEIDDMRAHEFKVGIRYHFGTDCCAQPSYVPMK